jgi:hypothetical protein
MTNIHRTAMQVGHNRLYHYENFRPEWLGTTLRERRIRCSNPAKLNDPWDCRPWYDTTFLKTPGDIESFLEWCRSIAEPPGLPDQQARFEYQFRTNAFFRQKFVEGFSICAQSIISSRRIYCLTPDPCSTLMWSHYAAHHTGICLGFNTDNSLFSEALEVIYRTSYPPWRPDEVEQIAYEILLTKCADWGYEREFRIIGGLAMEKEPLNLNGDFLRLPSGALQSVIVGCAASEDTYNAVIRIVSEHAPRLQVKRVVRVANHYRLTVEGQVEAGIK